MKKTTAFLLPVIGVMVAGPSLAGPKAELSVRLQERISPLEAPPEGARPREEARTDRRTPTHVLDPLKYAEFKDRAWTAQNLTPGRALSQDVPEPMPAPRAPKRKKSWDGISQLEGNSRPPDTIIAGSEHRVLEAVNTMLSLTDRDGESETLQSLSGFFYETGGEFLFDPKVYYDRLSERFFVVGLGQDDRPKSSSIYLAVSTSSDPASLDSRDWCRYRINAKRGATWADYPGLGMNENWLAIGVNNFTFGGDGRFKMTWVYALPKEELVDNADGCPGNLDVYRVKAKKDPDKVFAFNVEPAQHYSSEPGDPLYFVSTQVGYEWSRTYVIWRLEGDGTGKPRFFAESVTTDEAYSYPPYATQDDGRFDLDTGDTRILQVAYRDGALWAVQASGCSIGSMPNESCVRAVQFDPRGGSTEVVFAETYGGGNGWYYYWPGIGINGKGDVAVAFQASSNRDYLGIYYNGKKASKSSFDKVKALAEGGCGLSNGYDTSREAVRTGDYVGVQADPADDRGFWIAGEYAGTVVSACDWRTYVARVVY
jgi:hypothetical protein